MKLHIPDFVDIDDQLLDDYIKDYIIQLFDSYPPNEAAKILIEYADGELLEDAKRIAKELFPQHSQYIDAYNLLK
jgi:hypothetical protein